MALFLPPDFASQFAQLADLDAWQRTSHWPGTSDIIIVQQNRRGGEDARNELESFTRPLGLAVTPDHIGSTLDVVLFRHLQNTSATIDELCALIHGIHRRDCERVFRSRPNVFQCIDSRWSVRMHPIEFARLVGDTPDSVFLPPPSRALFI